MVGFSRFSHEYYIENTIALYHSLRMKPVYVSRDAYKSLQGWLASSHNLQVQDAPPAIKNVVEELIKYKILVQSEDEDEKVLNFVKSKIPEPAVNVCYMILSEQCNLACKYCFLGNNDKKKRSHFLAENMSKETADKALDFLIRQLKESGLDSEESKPYIIFYGGEPMVNFSVLQYISTRINELRKTEKCLKNADLSMVSNGLLIDEEKAKILNELGVGIAISVDGFTEKANAMRVNVAGQPVFSKVLEKLNMFKRLGLDIVLSVTLSEETIKNTTDILRLVDEYGVRGFGFNIMMSDDNFILPASYNEAASKFILDEFVELRKRGIYEDRVMRKLKSFSKSQVYFSDCAATAGGQIVIAPNGKVGICHGYLHDKKYFVADVRDDDFIAIKDPVWREWSQLTPVNKEECLDCAALGICGGGCPMNAMHLKKGNTIHSIDERFCVHAKMTLDFLIRDLYKIIAKETSE